MDIQDILLQLANFNFRLDLSGMAKRYETDAQRIEAAVMASHKKALEYFALAIQDPLNAPAVIDEALRFGDATRKLIAEGAAISQSLAKFQFPKDIWSGKYKDPFKDWRVRVKVWAETWSLDPSFRALL